MDKMTENVYHRKIALEQGVLRIMVRQTEHLQK
mgnify:FL=1